MTLKQAFWGCFRAPKVLPGGGIPGLARIGILVCSVLTGSLAQTTPVITLDGSGTGRMFEGVGAISAGSSSRLLIDYPEPYRSQILDYLFKPNYGAAFQDLKIELGGDMNSTDGSEPSHMHTRTDQNYNRGFEWWLMEQAKLRNPNITLGILAWGAPGWIGNGEWFSQDAINYIINYIQGAQTYHNLTINYVGILDERPYDPNWIIELKAAIQAAGLTTQVVAADESGGQIIADVSTNPALNAAVDVLGFHYPGFTGGPIPVTQRIWASEDGQAWNWNGNWPGASYLVQAFNRGYINSKITKHQFWSLITSYYDMLMFPGSGQMYANTPWSGNYLVQPAIWAVAHYDQFAGPGWQYVDDSSGIYSYASYLTLRNGSDFSLVIENINGPDTPLTFNIVNGLSTGPLHVWMSNQNEQFIQQPDIVPVNGSFSFTVAAGSIYSITTTTGQSKGNAVPAPAAPFPFPYADNFESEPLSGQAHYFFDLNGSFEIASCDGGRIGQCLRQAAPAAPIPWTTVGSVQPSSIIGSSSWDNYQVSADVFFEEPGQVKLMARLSGLNVNNGDMYGYELYLDNLGNWNLSQGNFVSLATGSVPLNDSTWHTLTMILNGAVIGVVIDGATVANVTTNETYSRGMAGLGVQSWTTAEFDNFSIQPIPGAGIPVPQGQMTATATGQTAGYPAANAIDGNINTFWISPYSCTAGCAPTQPLPQSLNLALGSTYPVESVTYLPRQDNNQGGNITSYNILVSADGINFTTVASGNWTNDATLKSASFTPISASWVQIQAVSGVGGMASAAEVNVYYSPGSTAILPPDIDSLIPNFATAGGAGFALTVAGNSFVPGSIVQWNGSNTTTTFVSSNSLSAMIPATDLTSAGTAVVSVVHPAQAGGGASSGQTFTINPSVGTGGGPAPPAATPFVTGYALGRQPVRNDFTGWVGMSLTTGTNPLTVSALGRVCVQGNANIHTVKFVYAASGADVSGGSASVNMAGCTPGQFIYSSISPLTLTAGAIYYLVSQETQGGDEWYDQGAVAATSVAAVNSAIYFYSASWYAVGSANTSYVPPNFQYSVVTPSPITVNVAASPAGPSFSVDGTTYTTAQVLTWTSGTSHTIATTSPQSAGAGTQYVWAGWSDNGANSHSVAPTANATYTASFTTQYLLTTSVSAAAGGSVSAGGYYNSGASATVTAAPAANCTFSGWSGSLTGSTNPASISMSAPQSVTASFQCSAPPPPPPSSSTVFVTGYDLSGQSLRNDFSGFVGMKLTVGTQSLMVSALGRICAAANAQTHTVKFVNASTGTDLSGASALVSMAGCSAGQFVYTSISPVTLAPGASYYLVSQETQGGDAWYDQGAVSTTTDATVNDSIYFWNGGWYSGTANASYVPPNFEYTTGAATPQYLLTTSVSPAGSGSIAASPSSPGGSYASGTIVQLTATPAANCTFSNWSGSLTGSANPASVTMSAAQNVTVNFQCSAPSPPPSSSTVFVTGYDLSGQPLRNNFTGFAGMNLTVGTQALTVSAVGRICVANNASTHTVKFVNAATGSDVTGASASVNMAGCTPGQFVYTAIAPVTLSAGTSYYLVSQETAGGDTWYDLGGVSTTSDAAVNTAVYAYNGSWITISTANVSYVPPDFQYTAAP